MGERLVAEIDNDVTEIARLTSRIERFGEENRLPATIVFHLTLALDELLTNIISYGFLDDRAHKIFVSIEFEGNALTAEIIDDGIAFDPLARSGPNLVQPLEERAIGGLGIHFIRTLMDSVDYRRSDGRNYFKMIKKVPAEPVE